MYLLCSNCGTEISEKFKFCPSCQTPVEILEDNILQDNSIDLAEKESKTTLADNVIQGSSISIRNSQKNSASGKSNSNTGISDNVIQDSQVNVDNSTTINNITNVDATSKYEEAKIEYRKLAMNIIQKIGREQWFRNPDGRLDNFAQEYDLDEATRIDIDDEVLELYNKKLERDKLIAKYSYEYNGEKTQVKFNAVEIAEKISNIDVLLSPFLIFTDSEYRGGVPFWSIPKIIDQENLKLKCSINETVLRTEETRYCRNCLLPVHEDVFEEGKSLCKTCLDRRNRFTSQELAAEKVKILNNEVWSTLPTSVFRMGGDSEKQCDVYLDKKIRVLKIPVTEGMFRSIDDNISNIKESLPITNINWLDAIKFCNKFSLEIGLSTGCYVVNEDSNIPSVTWDKEISAIRLPTEAEWEFLCRGGTKGVTFVPDNEDLWDYAWYDENDLSEVMKHKPNPYGLYDLLGNVWEWVWDDKYEYPDIMESPYSCSSKKLNKIVRGASAAEEEDDVRSTVRKFYPWDFKSSNIGFRVVIDQ